MSKSRDLIALDELSADDIFTILGDAVALQEYWQERDPPKLFADSRIALIVDDDGWRNTFAFELGIKSLGGACAQAPIKLGQREDTKDLAKYLENWCDALVIRTPEIEQVRTLAAAMSVPVINARTSSNHPCETLGDLAYVMTTGKSLDGLKVTVVSPSSNILQSWVEVSEVLPIEVRQVFDSEYLLDASAYRNFTATDEFVLDDTDVLVTDVWPIRSEQTRFEQYRITAELLDQLGDVLFLPCPPVHRGEEVSESALNHSSFVSYEAKEYLLHVQNAILKWALRK